MARVENAVSTSFWGMTGVLLLPEVRLHCLWQASNVDEKNMIKYQNSVLNP